MNRARDQELEGTPGPGRANAFLCASNNTGKWHNVRAWRFPGWEEPVFLKAGIGIKKIPPSISGHSRRQSRSNNDQGHTDDVISVASETRTRR